MSSRNIPDLEYRFGAFADTGLDEGDAVYFKTAAEAIAYAQGCWSGLDMEARRRTDVYAGEILFKEVNGRLGWSEVAVLYDAKKEVRA